ncbi:MAG TPA: N-acetylmuramoyl-L-alanine amidase [Candidatus Angelobacter sp.]|jgi:N-acetylmuramoyl-L-alanine amidase|nr:N-acetylmuramoyl-L-alanine amidase [Candidatus Angelobacter sp.]
MRWSKTGAGLAVVALCCAFVVSAAGPEQQLTIYTVKNSYSLTVIDRGGKPYISVTDLLLPLGASQPITKGKDWRSSLNKNDLRLTDGKDKGTINKQAVDLGGKALVENGRFMVPIDAVLPLLGRLLNTTIDFHQPARRIFIGSAFTRFTAEFKNGDQPSLVLNFSQPVTRLDTNHNEDHGALFTHTNKTTLMFRKDPLVSDLKTQQFGDGAIQSLAFSEENGAAVITITGNKHLQIIRSEDGKTITLQPQAPEASATPLSAQPSTPDPEGQKRAPGFFVMIDPSHGGNDKGATFGGKLVEKDITLRLARELRKELEERGIAVRLLRESDVDLSIDRRAEITNEQNAGIYVALHAGRPGKGVRVYTLALSDGQQPTAGRFLPWESAQSGALPLSQNVARAVSEELKKKGVIVTNMGVPLRPLNNIATPAVAVELAPDENDLQSLESQKRQNNVAAAIALGIVQVRSQMGTRQ